MKEKVEAACRHGTITTVVLSYKNVSGEKPTSCTDSGVNGGRGWPCTRLLARRPRTLMPLINVVCGVT